ncbi:MAG: hypothetical protein KDK03_14660 [Rhodobacteraceae bacterium]|nr:hypothetical protein [Paracoccaceae bacterium]
MPHCAYPRREDETAAPAVRRFDIDRDRLRIDLSGSGLAPSDVRITHVSRFVARIDYGGRRILLYGAGLDRLGHHHLKILT